MSITRTEILPGVWLSHILSDKFKTACLSVNLLTQLQRESASMNALIPYVLRRGTTGFGDMEQLSRRMDELYGCAIEPVVRRMGEIQCVGFYASLPEGDFLPAGTDVLPDAARLLGEMLLSPNTRGGLLLPQYVDSEKDKMLELIRSRINNKRGYSIVRCAEEMCCCENYAVSRYGSEEDCEGVNYKKLSKHYRSLLQTSPIEMFYCGRASLERVAEVLKDALATLPRGEIDYDLGTDVRMNALEDAPRFVEERLDVAQGKLVIGFRLGECMEEPDLAALSVFNSVFGGGTSSKLFVNVREKLSLCYYAGSLIDFHKGLLLVSSGIDFDKLDEARDEIFAQLDAMRRGELSDEELSSAKACVASELRASMDSLGELEGFYLSNTVAGLELSPMELAGMADNVTKDEVTAIANSVECDLVYFLNGNAEGGNDDAEE